MKKSGRKLLGIVLAISVAVAAVFPIQGMAAGNGGGEYENMEKGEALEEKTLSEEPGEEQQPSEDVAMEEPGEEQPSEHVAMEEPGEEQQPSEEDTSAKEPGEGQQPSEEKTVSGEPGIQQQTKEDTAPEAAGRQQPGETDGEAPKDMQPQAGAEGETPSVQPEETEREDGRTGEEESTEEAEMRTFMLPQGGEEESIMPLEDYYDINQPVIERFEFVENGQTLDKEDTLHFNMSVYDADSSVHSISVTLVGGCYYGAALEFQKSGEGNLYSAELPCSQLPEGNYYVSSIHVEDEKTNYVDGEIWGPDGQYLYQFIRKDIVPEKNVALSGFRMDKRSSNGDGTLKAEDEVTYTVDVQCENEEIESAVMCINECESNYSGSQFQYNCEYHAESNSLTGAFKITDKMYPTEWTLTYVRVYTKSGKYYYFYPAALEPEAELKFTVKQEYDKDKPVIESIDIGENGREVKTGETITIKVKVNEEHPSEWASARFSPQASNVSLQSATLKYNETTSEYVGEISITEFIYPCKWELTYLNIKDTYGNAANLSDYKGNGEEDLSRHFTVAPGDYDMDKPVIKSISFDKELAKAGDTVTIQVEVEETNPYSTATAQITPQDYPNAGYTSVSLSYRADMKAYIGKMKITASTNPGEWELTYLYVRDRNGNGAYLSDYEEEGGTGPWHYTVDPDGYDAERPMIESVTIDKNGEWVRAGETVTIKVKVKEKNPSDSGKAYFYPQVTNVSAFACVDLRFQASTQEYTGTIEITDDTYPCEWMLTGLEITDELGYVADLYDVQPNWQYTYPWYFKVKSGNTYREDVKDVTFYFYNCYIRQEDGSYALGDFSRTVENVGRRAALKELGVFPQTIEGVTASWKYNWYQQEVNEDTELLFDSTGDMTCYLYGSYDKGCANVTLTYMSEGSGKKTAVIPQFIDREAAYQDVLDALELPEDGRADDFVGFKLAYSDDSHNENTLVGDAAKMSAEAVYKNCQVAWNTRYLDEDGNEAARVVSKSYLEGAKVSDALTELEGPEGNSGMEFEGWVLEHAGEDGILSQSMSSFDVVAVYHGKTTVDASYTYRGEDGKIACDGKLMVIEGENLSDAAIQGEAAQAFKSVEHLPGLMLSEWTSAIDTNQEKYKKIQFQALYYNCVAVLKYPDKTCQYVVVDRNKEFTLPTENEKYTDILWEGFEKGQTVKIAEDTEFLVADAKQKDGTQEEPGGVKLSEDEIAKIKEEIEKAEAGAAITVNMKKATVVPKEILEAIKGTTVNIVLDMGEYSWSITGTDVNASDLKDIDLEVKIGTDVIPSSLIDSIAEGKPATQISLTHNGDFGFRADLTLNLGSENSGGTGTLYYYDSSGKLIFIDSGKIGADGTTHLSFSHASEYVVVVDKSVPSNGGNTNGSTGAENMGSQAGSGKEENAGSQNGTQEENAGNQENGTQEGSAGNQNGGTQEGNAGNQNDSTQEGSAGKQEDDAKEDTGLGDGTKEKDTREDHENGGTANIKKNQNNFTADSGETKSGDTDSDKMKSPKTGE